MFLINLSNFDHEEKLFQTRKKTKEKIKREVSRQNTYACLLT